MSCHRETLDTLKDAGYRLTPQRAIILEAIHHLQEHVTVDQILAYVEARYPNVDQSTVYRTLELLTTLDIVQTLEMSGRPTEYEVAADPHHHLVCRRCGNVIAVPAQYLDDVYEQFVREYGFKADLTHLAFTGLCVRCQQEPVT